jgi:hypothetical protein
MLVGYPLVLVLGAVVLGRNDQTSAFASAAVNSLEKPESTKIGREPCTVRIIRAPTTNLDNVDHLLSVTHCPVDLVVVSGSQINHHVLVAEEKHDRTRIIQLVHLVEVWDLGDVHLLKGLDGSAQEM